MVKWHEEVTPEGRESYSFEDRGVIHSVSYDKATGVALHKSKVPGVLEFSWSYDDNPIMDSPLAGEMMAARTDIMLWHAKDIENLLQDEVMPVEERKQFGAAWQKFQDVYRKAGVPEEEIKSRASSYTSQFVNTTNNILAVHREFEAVSKPEPIVGSVNPQQMAANQDIYADAVSQGQVR